MKSLVIASVISVVSVFLFVSCAVFIVLPQDKFDGFTLGIFMGWMISVYWVFILCVFAIPLHLFLKKRTSNSFLYYFSVVILPVTGTVVYFKSLITSSSSEFIFAICNSVVLTFIGIFVFWYILKRTEPTSIIGSKPT